MPVNKGLLISAAVANGLNAFLDAREKGDLQRQKLALEQVKQQMALTKSRQTHELAQEQEGRLQQGLEDTRTYRDAQIKQQQLVEEGKDERAKLAAGAKSFGAAAKAGGDAIGELIKSFRPNVPLMKFRAEQEAQAKEDEKLDEYLRIYGDQPGVEQHVLGEEAGLGLGAGNILLRANLEAGVLDKMIEGLAPKLQDKYKKLHAAGKLGIDFEDVSGSAAAMESQIKIDTMRLNKELTAQKLENEKYLSVEEAEALGVRHGITRDAAYMLGKEPGRYEIKEDKSGALVRIDKWTTDLTQAREVIFQPEVGMTPEALNFYYQRSKDFQALEISQDYYVMKKQVGRLVNTVAQIPQERKMGKLGSLVGVDQAIIMIYNKLSDETSVVRESEYARTGRNLPIISQMTGYFAAKFGGEGGTSLNDTERLALARMGMLYAEEAEVAWMGAAANEARKAEELGVKIQPLVGYGFVNIKGERVDTSRWDATKWEAEYEARRDAPQMKITDMVAVMAEDFNLPDASQAELAMIFKRSGLGVSPETIKAVEASR